MAKTLALIKLATDIDPAAAKITDATKRGKYQSAKSRMISWLTQHAAANASSANVPGKNKNYITLLQDGTRFYLKYTQENGTTSEQTL